jgi:hypothetical protein
VGGCDDHVGMQSSLIGWTLTLRVLVVSFSRAEVASSRASGARSALRPFLFLYSPVMDLVAAHYQELPAADQVVVVNALDTSGKIDEQLNAWSKSKGSGR